MDSGLDSTFENSLPLHKPADHGPSATYNRKADKPFGGRARADSAEVRAEGTETQAHQEGEARVQAEARAGTAGRTANILLGLSRE